jgi:hypothetical protein
MIKKVEIFLKSFPLEGYIWIAALLFLGIVHNESAHFTICPFNNLGIEFCPGCGLGKSIHHLISLNLSDSINTHPLGGIAFVILVYRIFSLTKNSMLKIKSKLSY